jgi:hypothetical protein
MLLPQIPGDDPLVAISASIKSAARRGASLIDEEIEAEIVGV